MELDQFFTPDLSARLEQLPESVRGQRKEITVDFAFLLIRGTTFDEISANSNTISEIAVRNKGCLVFVHGCLMSVAFGIPQPVPKSDQRRIAFVRDVMRKCGKDVSIIHGQRLCLVGNVGTSNRLSYGIHFDDYCDCLRALLSSGYGECKEI